MQMQKRFSVVERGKIANLAHQCLWETSGKPGLEYFLSRGLTESTIHKFKLGYIPSFVEHQLRGRIIFPFYDPSDNLIVVSSRRISENNNFLPVYWHESYEKSFYLYGIHLARNEMRKWKFVIVVEGQFDVLQLHNHGVMNVVGLCGTKLSNIQISVIQRYCDEIVLLLDTDENQAGQRGMEKVVESAGKVEMPYHNVIKRNIISVAFPENSDPDEFVRKNGIQELKQLIKDKQNEFYSRDY